jgi:chromosome segregation ATPase
MDKFTQEKESFEKRYAALENERLKLAEQVKKLKEEKPAVQQEQGVTKSQAEDAYWGAIFKAKTDMEIQLEALRNELKTARINNEQLQREKSALGLEVTNLDREKQDFKRQIEYNKKLMDSISQELVREKNDKFQIEESTRTIKSENITLRRQLASLTSRKISLERRLAELQQKNKDLDNRFGEMDVLLKEKMSQIDNLKSQLYSKPAAAQAEAQEMPQAEKESSVELPPIVVRPKQEPAGREPAIALIGKVMALNKDNNFVIIDLGEDSGVRLGDSFKAYREGRAIADLEVIQCRKSISACDIKNETAPIKVGDIVK